MLSVERLREVLDYDPVTGLWTWLVRRGPRAAGSRAGSDNTHGYLCIGIDGKLYRSSRLAWLYVTGEWPANEIDHKNGDSMDDRWGNLREATRSENNSNRASGSNTSGFKGVSWRKDNLRWAASIAVRKRQIHLGFFDNPRSASEAYRAAVQRYHGEFAHPEALAEGAGRV